MRRLSLTIALLFLVFCACQKQQDQVAQGDSGDTQPANFTGNPADGNLASLSQPGSEPVPARQAVPASPYYDTGETYNTAPEYDADQDATYQTVVAPEPPPPLPDYEQPPCPGDDYVWTPGYWDYAGSGYYWVPGAWVLAPYVGALWTPAWWGSEDGHYRRHRGYWATHIGYYGGIDYGYGYTGRGYYGAYWDHGHLDYNRSATNVNVSIVHNVYNYAVPRERGNRASYSGGHGGVAAQPTRQELAVTRDPRLPAVAAQVQHAREASANRAQFAGPGREHPAALVVQRPLPTEYRAPAARPPAEALRAARQPGPQPQQAIRESSGVPAPRANPQTEAPVQQQSRERFTPPPSGREAAPRAQAPAPIEHAPTVREAPAARPAPEARPAPQPERRTPQSGPAEQPNPPRPTPETRSTPQPSRAAPEARPEPPRPSPEARPARPPQRPESESRPAPVPHPAPEARPAPPPERPAPQARPAPPPEHPAPQARPAPPPERPAPQARPAPPPERPAPQARPAPPPRPEAHPAPSAEQKPAQKKDTNEH